MRKYLSEDKVKQLYLNKIKRLAYYRWEKAGCPEGKDLEFWLAAEKEQREKDRLFGGQFQESALPDYKFLRNY